MAGEIEKHNGLIRRSASWKEGTKKRSYIPIRKFSGESKAVDPSQRLQIRSLTDLESLNEYFFELIPQTDVFVNPQTREASTSTGGENKKTIMKRDYNSLLHDLGNNRGERSILNKLTSIKERHIDRMTTGNKEMINTANTQMPKGDPKSKSNESVNEGKIKKSGVQLKRCLSLYDRKRNPHFCKDTVFSRKEDCGPNIAFREQNSGYVTDANTNKGDMTKPETGRRISTPSDKLYSEAQKSRNKRRIKSASDKLNTGAVSERSNAGRREDMAPNKVEDTDETSTITSITGGSMTSSMFSLESESSSELDFDELIRSKSPRSLEMKSPRQSLIPVLIRPRSIAKYFNGNVTRDIEHSLAKMPGHRKNVTVKRSISLCEQRISSFRAGSSSVSIKIKQSLNSDESMESSLSSSSDEVFLTASESNKRKCVDIPEDEEGYPDPAPPSTDVFDPRQYVQVDQHALKAPTSLSSSFDDLISYLLQDLTNDLSKVRAIYRWIVSQTIPLTLTRHDVIDNSPLGFLYNIRERRASYSELMAIMCRKADLKCVIIHGLAKSLAYDVGNKVTYKRMKNSWNAVFIDGNWRLIHPYWASQAAKGHSTGRWAVVESDAFHTDDETGPTQQLVHTLSDFFFLTDPGKFITKCFPDNPQWQLLRRHISKSEFEALPFLQPAFYELKLKIRSHDHCVIHAENGKVELSLEMPKDKANCYKFRYKLYVSRDLEAEGEYDMTLLDRYLLYYHEENVANFEIRFPVSGTYKLELHCTDPKKQLPSDWVCDYKIICKTPMPVCNPLPVVPALGWGLGELSKEGLDCLTHKQAILSLDKESITCIRFSLPKDKEVVLEAELLHNDKSPADLHGHMTCEQDGEHATIQIAPPCEGEYALRVYARPKSSEKRKNVCNFLMHRTLVIEDPELADIRQNLLHATETGDVDALSYWMDKFNEKGMNDRGDFTAAKKKLYLAKLNRDIAEAIARKDLELLERTMNSISGTSIKRQLSHLAADAEAMRSRLRRLKRLRHAVLEMDQKTISEMRSYPKPPQAVHGVMAATFLLLGNKEIELKKWSKVQGLISRRGKEGLKKRVANFKSSKVTPGVLLRAKDILNKYDLESVQIASAGAATFYQWALTMVGEAEADLQKVT